MMPRNSAAFAVLAFAVLVGCDQRTTPPELLAPSTFATAKQDARDPTFAGSGVYLLPPIGTSDYVRTGPFDPDTDPRVEICTLDVSGPMTVESIEQAPCGDLVAWFETDASYDGVSFVNVTPSADDVAASDSMYSIAWKTSAEDAGRAFRVSILLPMMSVDGGVVSIDYAPAARFDAMLYSNASNKLDPDRIVGSTAGQNFPVKFIVEENASCSGMDCFAYRVTCEAAVYRTAHAGVAMPEDWAQECEASIPGPERDWWLFQERLPQGSQCLPSSLFDGVAMGACYVWQLVSEIDEGDATSFEPYTAEFVKPVTVQFCNDDVPEGLRHVAGMFRFSDPPGEVALVEEAHENAFDDYTCPFVEGSGTAGSSILSFVDAVRPALRLLGLEPAPLLAGDGGVLSGATIRMSDFQRAVQLELQPTTDLTFTAVAGSGTTIGTRLTTPPHHEPLDGPSAGVPGFEVEFRVVSGDVDLSGTVAGTLCPGETTTTQCVRVATTTDDHGTTVDEGGYAAALVQAGGSAGAAEIEASVPEDPDMAPVTFTAEVAVLVTTFLEPLQSGSSASHPDESFVPVLYICAEALFPCEAGTAAVVRSGADIKLVQESTGRKFYQTDWKPKSTGTPHGRYVAQVVVDGITAGHSVPIVVTKGGKGELVDEVYYNGENSTLPVKFTVARVSP